MSRHVQEDSRLVSRCLTGEAAAWSLIYHRFQPALEASVRAFLGRAGHDVHLIDEICARVWYALVRDGFGLLAKFDPQRGCRLSTFLSVLAKTEARLLLRAERRRKSREQAASKREAAAPAECRASLIADEEFIATLSPAERLFFYDVLIAEGDARQEGRYSQDNFWQLRHRVRKKLERYLR